MNFWAFSFLLANFVWALIFEHSLLKIYISLIGFYVLVTLFLRRKHPNSFRRKVQIATWNDSGDPCTYSRFEIDMTPVESFLEKYNAQNPENKIALTLIFTKALAMGLAKSRETFGKISFGSFVPIENINVSFLVDVGGENLANALLHKCEILSLSELNQELKKNVKEYKGGQNKVLNKQISLINYMPSSLVQAVLRVASFFAYDLAWNFPLGNVKPHCFGHGIVTNVVNFDICDSFGPLVPFLKGAFVAVMNTPKLRPMVEDGKVVIRKIMNFNFTYDYRYADVFDLGVVMKECQEMLKHPEKMV